MVFAINISNPLINSKYISTFNNQRGKIISSKTCGGTFLAVHNLKSTLYIYICMESGTFYIINLVHQIWENNTSKILIRLLI